MPAAPTPGEPLAAAIASAAASVTRLGSMITPVVAWSSSTAGDAAVVGGAAALAGGSVAMVVPRGARGLCGWRAAVKDDHQWRES